MCVSSQTMILSIVVACSVPLLATEAANINLNPRILSHPKYSIENYLRDNDKGKQQDDQGKIVNPSQLDNWSPLLVLPPFKKKMTAAVAKTPVKHINRVKSTNFRHDHQLKGKNYFIQVNRGRLLPYLHPHHLVKRSPKPPVVPVKIPLKFPIKTVKKNPITIKGKKPLAFYVPTVPTISLITSSPFCCDVIGYVFFSKPFKKPKKKSKPFKKALVVDDTITLKNSPLLKKTGFLPLAGLTLASGPILPLKKGPVKLSPKALKTGSKLPPAFLKTNLPPALAPLKKVPKAAAPLLPLGGKGTKVAKKLPAVLLKSQSQGNQRRGNGRSSNQTGAGRSNGLSQSAEEDKKSAEEEVITRPPTEEEKEAVLEAKAALEGAQATINQAQAALAAMRGARLP